MPKSKEILKSRGLAKRNGIDKPTTPNSVKHLKHNCGLLENHIAKQIWGRLTMFGTRNYEIFELKLKWPNRTNRFMIKCG